MKRPFIAALAAIASILCSSCTEEFLKKDSYGTFELTLSSSIGSLNISELQLSDGSNLLLQIDSPVTIDANGKTLEFKIEEGSYEAMTLALATDDNRTGLFTLKSGVNVPINRGSRTKCALTVTSLKDNSAAEEAMLPNGRMFNMAVKAMTIQGPDSLYCVYGYKDTLIKSIKFITESPSTDGIRIDSYDAAPAYATFDKATGEMIISTGAKRFHMGLFPSFMFTHLEALESIDFGNMYAPEAYKIEHMFSYCRKLKSLDLKFIESTERCNSMDNLFSYCESLESVDISHFRTSNVEHMRSMFNHCSSLKSLDLSHFDTSKCKNMTYMFYYSGFEKLDLSSFSINHLAASNMTYFFMGTSNLCQITLPNGFYPSDKASPSCFFASNSLAYADRTGSKAGGLTICADADGINWIKTTTLRWINSGYKNSTAIPVTFIDNATGNSVAVTWPAN